MQYVYTGTDYSPDYNSELQEVRIKIPVDLFVRPIAVTTHLSEVSAENSFSSLRCSTRNNQGEMYWLELQMRYNLI